MNYSHNSPNKFKTEKIIKKDLKKANMEFKRLGKYREYKESKFHFWLNSIGGHIPIFSNILTVVEMGTGFYEKNANKKRNM